MSIMLGNRTSDPSQMFYGSKPLKEVWVGDNKIWPTGPQVDALYWFDFDNSSAVLKNRGTSVQNVAVSGAYPAHSHDHVFFAANTRMSVPPPTGWLNGYTTSMWVRDTPVNSGWKTFLHRAPSTGWVKETYVVLETNATTTTVVSGLRFPPTQNEYRSNYSFPVSSDWTHIVVVWARTSSTTFQCRFYINGVARGVFNGSGYLAGDQFTSENLFIGGNRDAGEWSGRLDDFLLWDRPLSATEVTELYNQGRSWIPQILTPGPFGFSLGESGHLYFAADFEVLSWSATGLPDGLTMSSAGFLSGAATTEGSGTMVVTASGDGITATKAFAWSVIKVPSLSTHAIRANGANKISHSGWARPAVTWLLMYADTGAFEANGTLISAFGRGRINVQTTLATGRSSRVVSNIKGVIATGSGTSQNYTTPTMILERGERLHLEIQDYSSNANDRFYLFIREPA